MDRLYVFCALVFCFSAFAEDIKVVFTKGNNFKITSEGKKIALKKNLRVVEDDTITTASNGFAILKIENHSVFRVEEGSELIVSQLPYFFKDSKDIDEGASIIMKTGSAVFEMLMESETETLSIKNKQNILGVRGTKFLVGMQDDDLVVSVNEGVVELSNSSSKQKDFIEKGESIIVEKGLNFTARKRYKFQNDIDWNTESKKRKTRFKDIRKKLRSEFVKKRRAWTADPLRSAKFTERWDKRRERFKERTKGFSPSEKKKARMKFRQEKRAKMIRNGLPGTGRDNKPNQFMENRRQQKTRAMKRDRIRNRVNDSVNRARQQILRDEQQRIQDKMNKKRRRRRKN